jgi:hypothetical protein
MGNARPVYFSNVSFFKTNELTKTQDNKGNKSVKHVSEGWRVGKKKKEQMLRD